MRVLYHHRTLAEDAQGVHIEEICRALERRGHTVREASLVRRGASSGAASSGEGAASGGRGGGFWRVVARLARGPLYELLEYLYNVPAERHLGAEIREFRPHLVYERYALSTVAGIRAARRAGVPHLLEVNAPLVEEKRRWGRLWFGGLARRVERWIFRNTDRVIVVSDVLADRVRGAGVPAERIQVVRNGADIDRFHPRTPGERVRARFGIDSDGVVLGFVGWFRPWHDVERVIDAMASDELADLPVHLLLVGDGPARASIEERARRAGLSDRVSITGAVNRSAVPRYVAAFDVALQPAATEYACPMKIAEYLAAGKPVVACDQPNLRELIRDGEEGRLFEPGDTQALARALFDLVSDPDRRAELGRKARRRVHDERWTWLGNADRILEMQREVASAGARRCGEERGAASTRGVGDGSSRGPGVR